MRYSLIRLHVVAFAGFVAACPACGNVVGDWNKTAIETLKAGNWEGPRRIRIVIAVTMSEIAAFDALNAIDPRYVPYAYKDRAPPGASEIAAASQAAFRVLATIAPDQAVKLQATNEAVLATVGDAASREAGVAVGEASAKAILAARRDDQFDRTSDFALPPPGPGVYRKTSEGELALPHFSRMRPFALATSAQFHVPPPPPLDSPQFLRDLAEVREKGAAGERRDAEDVAIAKFHEPSGFYPWNDIGRQAAAAGKLDLLDTARVLALLDIAMTDTLAASFESKYSYLFWRPLTAIQAGGAGFGHPEIAPDPNWKSVIEAPMFPEYPCMHCAGGGAARTVLEALLPGGVGFTVTGGSAPRVNNGFRQYAAEETEARILGGVHFRWSTFAGDALGQEVAQTAMKLMAPTK
jgi:hypothetical protein